MEHCDKGPQLERIEKKVDGLSTIVASIAVQSNRLDTLEDSVHDHETRVRLLESAPMKRLARVAWMAVGGAGTVVCGVLVALIVYTIGVGR